MSTTKEHYRQLCSTKNPFPLFQKSWWLDATCGEQGWETVLVEKNGDIVGALPYFPKKKLGFKILSSPLLTQSLGVWIKYPPNQKYASKLSLEKEVLNEVTSQLPPFDFFSQGFQPEYTNWLPWKWKGFSQRTHYTYIVDTSSDEEQIYANFKTGVRGDIRKAQKIVMIESTEDIDLFYEINNLTFERQHTKAPYSLSFIRRFDATLSQQNSRRILIAKDNDGNIHASIYLVFDQFKMYYLMGGRNPTLPNSGAMSFLIWEGIKLAKKKGLHFDFEGSMIEPIERFFRSFGATQTPYFVISKTNSKLLSIGLALKNIFRPT